MSSETTQEQLQTLLEKLKKLYRCLIEVEKTPLNSENRRLLLEEQLNQLALIRWVEKTIRGEDTDQDIPAEITLSLPTIP